MKFIENVKQAASAGMFKVKKASPEICMFMGLGGLLGAAVLACRATLKAQNVVIDAKCEIEEIHDSAGALVLDAQTERRELTKSYSRAGLSLAKLYAPSVVLAGVSTGAIIKGNKIMRGRNVALAAAYASLDKFVKDYSGRVKERYGEEVERELRYGLKKEKVEVTVIDADGNEMVEKHTVKNPDPNARADMNPCVFFYDQLHVKGFKKDSSYNLVTLKAQQAYACDLLKTRGHLFLNEVLDMIGIDRTIEGQSLGWVYDKDSPRSDNYVDFGFGDAADFLNGYNDSVILNFNCDGDILQLMPSHQNC